MSQDTGVDLQVMEAKQQARQLLRREYFKAALTGLLAQIPYEDYMGFPVLRKRCVEESWMTADEAVKQEDEAVEQEQEPE